MTLLDITIPAASWLGVAVTIVLGLLVYLMKDTFQGIKQRITNVETTASDLEAKLEGEKLNTEKALRLIDGKVNDLHINILNRLDEIKDKFQEFRK